MGWSLGGVAALACTVLVAAGCGKESVGVSVAPDALARAAKATKATEGARVTMRMKFSGGEIGNGATVTAEGEEDLNGDRWSLEMDLAPAIKASGEDVDGPARVLMVYLEDVLYMSPEGEGADEITHGKRWVKIDQGRLARAIGIDADALAQLGGERPSDSLEYLNGADDVKLMGNERVRGVATKHYRMRVSFDDLLAQTPKKDRAAAQRAIDRLGELGLEEEADDAPFDVWVDARDLVRRVRQKVSFESEGDTYQVDYEVEYYDYGTRMFLKAPPRDAVHDYTGEAIRELRDQLDG